MKSLLVVNTAWCAFIPPASEETTDPTDPSLTRL